jgi:hypothetical protein
MNHPYYLPRVRGEIQGRERHSIPIPDKRGFLEERSAEFALAAIDLGKKAQGFLKYPAAKSRKTTSMKG